MTGVLVMAKNEKGAKVLEEYYAQRGVGFTQRQMYQKMYRNVLVSEHPLSFKILVMPGVFARALTSEMILLQLEKLLSEENLVKDKDYHLEACS